MPRFSPQEMQRPGFSFAMEILCSIPVEPNCVSLAALVDDFGGETQAAIMDVIARLKATGFKVCMTHAPGRINKNGAAGRVVYCEWQGWEYIQKACNAYLEAKDTGGMGVSLGDGDAPRKAG